jgi:cation transport regulator ChaC
MRGTMLYFAYGSNMEKEQMESRCPGYQLFAVARLDHYDLVFTRYSERWEGGVADLLPAHGKVVYGIIYDITMSDLKLLDHYTGYPTCYTRGDVIVETTDHKKIPALTYFAVRQGEIKPSRQYRDQIVKGAQACHLPGDYISYLRLIKTKD